MADDYIWKISYASNVEEVARNNSVQYGDGYEQVSPDGINNLLIAVSVVHEHMTDAELEAALTLLRTRRGVTYFLWTPPIKGYDTVERKFRCDTWRVQPLQFNDSRLEATFRQVFDL